MALHFELVSPERSLRSGTVHQVVVPGTSGDFGVLENHAPVLSTIRPGTISIYETESAAPERIFVDGGFAEVGEKGLTILAEHATPVAEIDVNALSAEIDSTERSIEKASDDSHRAQYEKRLAVLHAKKDAAAN